ncbi:Uncharacterized protein FWK35_00035793, partial [Aphis craccivora]
MEEAFPEFFADRNARDTRSRSPEQEISAESDFVCRSAFETVLSMLVSINHYLRFIYDWSNEMTSIKWCEQKFNLSENTVIDRNNYFREVCAMAIENKPQRKICGSGKIEEIDES